MPTKELTKETALKYLMDAYGKTASLIEAKMGEYIFVTDTNDYFCVELSDSGETVDVSRITIDSGNTLTKEEPISYYVDIDIDNKKYLAKHSPMDGIWGTEYYEVPDDFDLLNYSGMLGNCKFVLLDENQLSIDIVMACIKLLGINPVMMLKEIAIPNENHFLGQSADERYIAVSLTSDDNEFSPFISVEIYNDQGLLEKHEIALNKGEAPPTLKKITIKSDVHQFLAEVKDFLSKRFGIDYVKSTEEGIINPPKTINGVNCIEVYKNPSGSNLSESSGSEKVAENNLNKNKAYKDIAKAYMELLGIDIGQEPSWEEDARGNQFTVINGSRTIGITLTLNGPKHTSVLVLERDDNKANEYEVTGQYAEDGQLELKVNTCLTQQYELKKRLTSLIEAIKVASDTHITGKKPLQLVTEETN